MGRFCLQHRLMPFFWSRLMPPFRNRRMPPLRFCRFPLLRSLRPLRKLPGPLQISPACQFRLQTADLPKQPSAPRNLFPFQDPFIMTFSFLEQKLIHQRACFVAQVVKSRIRSFQPADAHLPAQSPVRFLQLQKSRRSDPFAGFPQIHIYDLSVIIEHPCPPFPRASFGFCQFHSILCFRPV